MVLVLIFLDKKPQEINNTINNIDYGVFILGGGGGLNSGKVRVA